ncbi:unnamed protein product [Cylindrotheca closterium]|uniref:Nucleotide-diphospho-sugar transferase domain-containing protein n=1 Tax=Cylindrotheca closterium TaxID=2856 RepID=A0AAD2CM70_9STRA|nr:unnamed protein product [Cylindrotheca closterium]
MKFKRGPNSGPLRIPHGGKSKFQVVPIITHVVVGMICFYLGILMKMTGPVETTSCPSCPECPASQPAPEASVSRRSQEKEEGASDTTGHRFPSTLQNFMHNYGTIPREDLNSILEIGVPLDEMKPPAETKDAIILYPSANTMPKNVDSLMSMNASTATENCMSVKVILQDNKPKKKQCLVVMPQWESYHVHKFMRLEKQGTKPENPAIPLRYVSTSHRENGAFNGVPGMDTQTLPFYKTLVEYLGQLERVIAELKVELEKLNSKTIIVLVCNHGQSELLHNFVCNARAKGLDLSQLFLFATDEKTHELAQSLGIASFHDESVFMDMPEQAAGGYGDRIFAKMMMAKVYCVHLVLQCGFNVLFQDVDVVWYKDPLPYLEGPELAEWDMMFQDDGARSNRYAPYSPNTGFYYVRHNEKTVYFFNMLLRHGDYITKVKSHQAGLVAVMNEHVSWKGLRVKTFPRGDSTKFPGGAEYHRYKVAMKKWITTKSIDDKPMIFHMSWTTNKKNKRLYFEQMGEWYTAIATKKGTDECSKEGGLKCCLAQANVTCHYRDKPSAIYCGMMDPIDKGRGSFWKDDEEILTFNA